MKSGEARIITVNGIQTYKCRRSHFTDRGFNRHFILIEELTREILATQKRAYEKVIRMMSHEINNSVGAVNSILDSSLHYRTQLTSEDREDFENAIRVAIDRNRGLNKFMTNFADVVRIPPPAKRESDLHPLLRSVHVLMSAECEKRVISWNWELTSEPLIVEIDYQQIEQALVNIIKNAIEAIVHKGSITIQTTDAPPTLRVIDTGKGISPEQRSHLFTPFYSTKKDGQGVGLTLIREILVNHGFRFNLELERPGRTEFWIVFDSESIYSG
jgi:signal transduction histidine kinase